MWIEYEPNPVRTGAIDCSTRALAKALNVSWERAYVMKCLNGFLMGDEGVSDDVWGSVLRQHGFRRYMVPNTCPDCYTVEEFAKDHPVGTYVVKTQDHVATIQEGNVFDSWNSLHRTVIYYWTDRKDGN